MASIKAPKILFFVAGAIPTLSDRQTAGKMVGAQVMFRNSTRIGVEHSPEAADGVAGDVIPVAYSKYPSYTQAMETHKANVEAETAKFAAATQSLAGQTAVAPVQTPAPSGPVPVAAQGPANPAAPAPGTPGFVAPVAPPQFPGAQQTQPGTQAWTPNTTPQQ